MCKEKRYYDGRGKQANSIYAYTNTRTTSCLVFLLFCLFELSLSLEREKEKEKMVKFSKGMRKSWILFTMFLSLKMIYMNRVRHNDWRKFAIL